MTSIAFPRTYDATQAGRAPCAKRSQAEPIGPHDLTELDASTLAIGCTITRSGVLRAERKDALLDLDP